MRDPHRIKAQFDHLATSLQSDLKAQAAAMKEVAERVVKSHEAVEESRELLARVGAQLEGR